MQFYFPKRSLLVTLLTFFLFWSCEKPGQDSSFITVSMTISEVGAEAGEKDVFLSASDVWELSLSYSGSDRGWATLNKNSGEGTAGGILLSYDANTTGKSRTLTLSASSGNFTSAWNFTQSSHPTDKADLPASYHEDAVGNWMELPAVSEADGLCFFSHRHTTARGESRNWSYYWDIRHRVAHWVAYPLNSDLIGAGVRTDAWGVTDPHLPNSMQPVFHGRRGFSGGYQRGHQLPSADRLKKVENEMTFYGTNMTPQIGDLNTKVWRNLEGRVRDWSKGLDTLYVVTGCVVDGSKGSCTDAEGKSVSIPSAYFKALLGFSKSGTASRMTAVSGGYTATAYYVQHTRGSYRLKNMTIDELEDLVGMDFFVNLPSEIGARLARKVESGYDDFWIKQ